MGFYKRRGTVTNGNLKRDGRLGALTRFRVASYTAVLRENAVRAFRRCQIFFDEIRTFREAYRGFSFNFSGDVIRIN